jgi:hypothetical protein
MPEYSNVGPETDGAVTQVKTVVSRECLMTTRRNMIGCPKLTKSRF